MTTIMTLQHWLAFVTAAIVLCAIPGPTILLVISYALGHGKRAAMPLVAGVALGDFTAMTASMLGLGAILAASAGLFTVLKWVGAAYLVYLGIKLFRAPVGDAVLANAPTDRPLRMFMHAWAVTALNPKSIVFFVAFLPQFLDLTRPLFGQMLIFELTFLAVASINATVYALAASGARATIRKPGVQRAVNRVGGSAIVAMGLATATMRRAPV